jgi:hypothetical protein
MNKFRPEQVLRIPIAQARHDGIYPMPQAGQPGRLSAQTSASSASAE